MADESEIDGKISFGRNGSSCIRTTTTTTKKRTVWLTFSFLLSPPRSLSPETSLSVDGGWESGWINAEVVQQVHENIIGRKH